MTRLPEMCVSTLTAQHANSWFETAQLQGAQLSLSAAFTGLHALSELQEFIFSFLGKKYSSLPIPHTSW